MNELRSRWLIAAFPLSVTLVFCTSTGGSGGATTSASATSSTSGTGGAGGHASGGTGGDGLIVTIGAGGAGKDLPIPLADAGLPPDAAVPPPVVACGADAAEICPLPPSYCADYEWLVFYQSPECVNGTCQYEAWAKKCVGGQACHNGGCEYNLTL
jgi:hypothetical protein